MAAIVGYEYNFAKQRIQKYSDVNSTPVKPDESSSSTDSTEEQSEKEKLLAEGGWQTPQEYYANATSSGGNSSSGEGEKQYKVVSEKLNYFWIEDLKNWGVYFIGNFENSFCNYFHLCLWNGKDNWIPIIPPGNVEKALYPKNLLTLQLNKDDYGISNLQNKFLENDVIDPVIQHRGLVQAIHSSNSDGTSIYTNPTFYKTDLYLQVVHAIKLKKQVKYGINDTNNFKTIAYSTNYIDMIKPANVGYFAQSNFRAPVLIGAPPVWRSSTGEVTLCTILQWNVDNGHAYYYKKIKEDKGFRKYYNPDICSSNGTVATNKIMSSDVIASMNWLNDRCAKFFGNGNNKTIEYDWLQEYNTTVDKSEYSNSSGKPSSMLNSELVFEQHNINKENSLRCGFKINRPVVTTTERNEQEYAKKW